jgi:hypothetical protein
MLATSSNFVVSINAYPLAGSLCKISPSTPIPSDCRLTPVIHNIVWHSIRGFGRLHTALTGLDGVLLSQEAEVPLLIGAWPHTLRPKGVLIAGIRHWTISFCVRLVEVDWLFLCCW